MQSLENYISSIDRLFQTRNAREHSYRGDLQEVLNKIINDTSIIVTNEPARIRDVGAPDYSIVRGDIPIGYVEAKDVDKSLDSKEFKEQFDRYKNALDNLLITNYLEFWFYRGGKLTHKIDIAKIENSKIVAVEENFDSFKNSILDFTAYVSQSIKSPSRLAKLMAGKARLLENVIEKAVLSEEQSEENSSLKNQMEIFKRNIIHDITPQSFADIYAQTIAYGMFTARLHDKTLQNFSRQEAQYLIPKSNPFLRGLFNYIGGVECDDRLVWIIDSLAEVFLATNIEELFVDYGSKSGMNDPILHFYETFLGEYNPKLRKARGVWYTPQSVVDFIVRSVDEVLKSEFDLEDGLVDDSKIKIKVDDKEAGFTSSGKQRQKEITTHKVQILDPATGTGTFLAQTIKFIKKEFWGGSWSSYVENSLIPRLNGFELLMASYAMAHLKLDLLLMESGYKPIKQKRFNVFLTNSLEEHHEHAGTLFSSYLANESKEADRIKKETPVMVVMGNPPYSGHSSNKNDFIDKLLEDYKKEWDGSKLKEKNPKWINDDYVKFIRYSESYIQKNEEGILAFITNNSYLNNPTFRGMRYHLLKTFDKIYIIDLHGDAKKKEVCSDGSKDENVFDIMQGVSIIIGIKKNTKSKNSAKLYLCDIYGKRDFKYTTLDENSLKSLPFERIKYKEPEFYFAKQNFVLLSGYENSFKIHELFMESSLGIQTHRDSLCIDDDKNILKNRIENFYDKSISDDNLIIKYNLKESKEWKLSVKRNGQYIDNNIRTISYRPFDNQYIYYSKDVIDRDRFKIMKNIINDENNLGIAIARQCASDWRYILVSNHIIESNLTGTAGKFGSGYFCPLYLSQDDNSLDNTRTPNLNLEIVAEIEKALKLKFVNEKIQNSTTFAPIDILDYIYAVLHSPNYREKYKEFLKIDFPRVPYPDPKIFWKLVQKGGNLRALHLMEDESLNERIIDIAGEGEMLITNKLNKKDASIENNLVTLQINADVSIINIPLTAWEFYIGGYQPAQKWLKDRVGRELSRTDLKHYNKIINALVKTDEVMKEIDKEFKI